MEFWDREKEIEYLRRYIKSEPNAILFVYGPKSSGKSTLLMKVIEQLSKERKFFRKEYQIYWFDLRGKFISSYENVVDLFFLDMDAKASKEIMKKEEFAGFNIGVDEFIAVKGYVKKELSQRKIDPFVYMENVLRRNRKNKVIVFDELQKLKGIYMNGQRELITELFNFFVRLTKVLHLSHVIVMTSDTFFIERVYTDSTLKNTSIFYEVDFFDDETTYKILKDHNFSDEDAHHVVDWVGGVPWMLERIILEKDIEQTVKRLFLESKARLRQFLGNIAKDDTELFKKLLEILRKVLEGGKIDMISPERSFVEYLVEAEILYYDPIEDIVRFQTKLDERAAKEILEKEL